jgi:hypothetical protein
MSDLGSVLSKLPCWSSEEQAMSFAAVISSAVQDPDFKDLLISAIQKEQKPLVDWDGVVSRLDLATKILLRQVTVATVDHSGVTLSCPISWCERVQKYVRDRVQYATEASIKVVALSDDSQVSAIAQQIANEFNGKVVGDIDF